MKTLSKVQILGLVATLVAMWFGLQYFQSQSLLTSGKSHAENILEDIEAGDEQSVKAKLHDYAGVAEGAPKKPEQLKLAIINVDFLSTNEGPLSDNFVGHYLEELVSTTYYRAVYEISAASGSKDYIVVIFEDMDGTWGLANIALSATDPIQD